MPVGTVMVRVEVPAPVMDGGLKPNPNPVGPPDADNAMTPSNPPPTVLVIVDAPLLPGATETDVGKAERLKLGDAGPVRAASNPAFGLPHPVTRSKPVTAE